MFDVLVFLTISFLAVFSLEIGERCINPNGELATCVPIYSCGHILDSLLTLNPDAAEFAKESQCQNDNETLVCCGNSTFFDAKLDISLSKLIPNRTVCGLGKMFGDRIHGGQEADIDEYPWMVLLGYKNNYSEEISFKCGGTVINNRYVLTAAHCIRVKPEYGISLHLVRLGEWNITSIDDCHSSTFVCADPVVDSLIEKQIAHPKYSTITGNNDIGLLRLEKNIVYSTYIQPICLPFNKIYRRSNNSLIVSGWGATEMGASSNVKLKLEVPLVSNSDCQIKLGKRGKISQNQICAGGDNGKDACQGDSGGPLMRYSEAMGPFTQWFQEGIVSWGSKCGISGYPGIYTRVSEYLLWIIDNMKDF